MKNILKIAVLGLALLGLSTFSAHAQGRIATVDMQRIFKEYWMTQQSQITLQNRTKELEKTKLELVEGWKKIQEEYKKLLADANDQAVNAEERDKRKIAAQAKLKDIQETEANIKSFDAQATTTLDEMRRRLTDNIFTEIRKGVAERAKKAGIAMVFDNTAMIYNSGDNDITTAVIAVLNEKAPVELAPRPEEKK